MSNFFRVIKGVLATQHLRILFIQSMYVIQQFWQNLEQTFGSMKQELGRNTTSSHLVAQGTVEQFQPSLGSYGHLALRPLALSTLYTWVKVNQYFWL